MGSKGNNRHIKRLAAQRYLHIERKVHAYIMKPNAGRHTLGSSIALATVIKEKLGLADTTKEAKSAIKSGSIEINGKVIRDMRYPLGFGDIVHLKSSGESYVVGVGKRGSVSVTKLQHNDSGQTFKVVGKYVAAGNKEMLRLHSGAVLQSAGGAKVNDSVKILEGKISEVVRLEKGARCLVIKGIHASENGVISDIKPGTALRSSTVEIEGEGGKTETLLDNIMVVGGK
ncbi:MAG: S4 domain-containing protein [Candidatus Marsarchaeota archaeon]|nr:S4 domain-containing protein [Candidatus Marsarchaeota archaeon]MCL5413126.1 S4 domain-containing protein [Candidatus Marsarchaeota archaeon]